MISIKKISDDERQRLLLPMRQVRRFVEKVGFEYHTYNKSHNVSCLCALATAKLVLTLRNMGYKQNHILPYVTNNQSICNHCAVILRRNYILDVTADQFITPKRIEIRCFWHYTTRRNWFWSPLSEEIGDEHFYSKTKNWEEQASPMFFNLDVRSKNDRN